MLASFVDPQAGQTKTPGGGAAVMTGSNRALAQGGGFLFPGQIEKLEEALRFLGSGQKEPAVEDETGHAVDAVPASERVFVPDFLRSLDPGEKPIGLRDSGLFGDLGENGLVADVAAFDEIGGEQA